MQLRNVGYLLLAHPEVPAMTVRIDKDTVLIVGLRKGPVKSPLNRLAQLRLDLDEL